MADSYYLPPAYDKIMKYAPELKQNDVKTQKVCKKKTKELLLILEKEIKQTRKRTENEIKEVSVICRKNQKQIRRRCKKEEENIKQGARAEIKSKIKKTKVKSEGTKLILMEAIHQVEAQAHFKAKLTRERAEAEIKEEMERAERTEVIIRARGERMDSEARLFQ